MESSWIIRWALNPTANVLIRDMWAEMPRGGDVEMEMGTGAMQPQGMPVARRSWKKPGRASPRACREIIAL